MLAGAGGFALKVGFKGWICTGMLYCSVPPTGAFCVALHCLSLVSEVVWGWGVASCTFGTVLTYVITAQDLSRMCS